MTLKEKQWDHKQEKELFEQWEKEKIYKFDPNSKKQIFSIDTPPAYPSGHWHIGAIAAYSIIDMIARYKRMTGHDTLFPFYLDRNGLPIELIVEKKFKKGIWEFEREDFLKKCQEYAKEYSDEIYSLAKQAGLSADFDDYEHTDSQDYRTLTQTTFIEIFKKKLVYEDLRPNNWCPSCRTTIADAEIEYAEGKTVLNYIKFKIKETGEDLTIATTRPELLSACQAILIHPDDKRYKKLKVMNAIIPIYNRTVPIKTHAGVKTEFGTGALMICSYGDGSDITYFRELNLKPIEAINIEGKMTDTAGKYAGLTVEAARKAITEDLKRKELIAKQEIIEQRIPLCERSKTRIEFISMKEWYIKQLEFLDDLREITKKIKFYPEKNRQILSNWIDSLTIDWPISRRRYYGTEIPLWYCTKCNEPLLPPPGKYYKPWKEKAPFDKCPKCKNKEFIGDDRVFDTWMDSSISNLYIAGYGEPENLMNRAYPTSLRPQGRDIVRTWLYYTLLRNYQLTGKQAFENIMIHGMGLDAHGEKMSKSKGNTLEPKPILDKYGADAFRLWAASEANIGEDFRIDENRIAGSYKFLTKLWNLAKLIGGFKQSKASDLKETDKWILSELNQLIAESRKGFEEFNPFPAATKTREFIWNIFASHYVEMIKGRAYDGDPSALYTLHTCLETICALLAPISPFMTDKINRELYGKSIHKEPYPENNPTWQSKILLELTPKIIGFNSEIWKRKKEKGIPLNGEISGIKIPSELKQFEDDLRKMHKVV